MTQFLSLSTFLSQTHSISYSLIQLNSLSLTLSTLTFVGYDMTLEIRRCLYRTASLSHTHFSPFFFFLSLYFSLNIFKKGALKSLFEFPLTSPILRQSTLPKLLRQHFLYLVPPLPHIKCYVAPVRT